MTTVRKKRIWIPLCIVGGLVITLLPVILFFSWLLNATNYSEEPVFIDRTAGWEASLLDRRIIRLSSIEKYNSPLLWNKLLYNVLYSEDEEICLGETDQDNLLRYVEAGMRLYLKDDYIDMGTKQEPYYTLNDDGTIWVYWGGETFVAIQKSDGKLLSCFDTRLGSPVTFVEKRGRTLTDWYKKYPCACYTVDFATMTAEELFQYHLNNSYWHNSGYYDLSDRELPLTAEDAYELSVETCADGKLGLAQYSMSGGDFYVYYSGVSDAYLVIGPSYIQAISRETGKQLLLYAFPSKYSEDASKEK